MLDLPDSDTTQLIEWGNRMVGNTDPDHADVLANSPESKKYRNLPFRSPTAQEVFDYSFALINAVPADGITTDDRDFRNYFLLLVVAGNETTRHTISHTMNTLIEHPAQLRD